MFTENCKNRQNPRLRNRPAWSVVILMLIIFALASGGATYAIQGRKNVSAIKQLENKILLLESELDKMREKPGDEEPGASTAPAVETSEEQHLFSRAFDVIMAIKNKDMKKLSGFIHPDKGVRFSPYGYIDMEKHLLFAPSHVQGLFQDKMKFVWGTYDGTGDPINMTFEEYYNKFIYDVDFANAEIIGNNTVVGHGNSLINISGVYPGAVFIEFHFPGFDPQYNGMDWRSLRLVFEEKDGAWYIVGIVHDQWTI